MGDRSTCALRLAGILSAEHIPVLAAALLAANPEEYKKVKQVEVALRRPHTEFSFYDVNHAQLDPALERVLKALRLSYAWQNGSGDEYGPGVLFYDARTGFSDEFAVLGDDIMLTIRDAKRPEAIENAEYWQKFDETLELKVVDNHHEALKLHAASDYFASYAKLNVDTSELQAA